MKALLAASPSAVAKPAEPVPVAVAPALAEAAVAPAPLATPPDPAPVETRPAAALHAVPTAEPATPPPDAAEPPSAETSDAAEDTDDSGIVGATVVQMHPAVAPAPRTLDENLLAILREEAARETAVRRAEAPAMPEVQPDLGLTAAAPAPEPTPERNAIASAPPVTDLDAMEAMQGTGDRVAPRRDLLPDIEEINSTLRAGSEARGAEAEALILAEKARTRGGFRAGFVVTLMIAVLLTAAYTMAPRIAQHLPGSAPVMASYVQGVDVARVWLDDTMQRAVGALRGLTGETP